MYNSCLCAERCRIAVGAWPAEARSASGAAWKFQPPRGRYKLYPFAAGFNCSTAADCYGLVSTGSKGTCRAATTPVFKSNATLLGDGVTVQCQMPKVCSTASACAATATGAPALAYLELEALQLNVRDNSYRPFTPVPRIVRSYSDSPVSFYSRAQQVFTNMLPSIGPLSGGTDVRVNGSGFVALRDPNNNNREAVFRKHWDVPYERLGEITIKFTDSATPGPYMCLGKSHVIISCDLLILCV